MGLISLTFRYQLQRGIVVIPKSIFPNELEANMDIEGWELTPEQCKDIGKLIGT